MYYVGSITLGTSGTAKAFNVGFQPTWAEFMVCGKNTGTTDAVLHCSEGAVDTTKYTYCASTYSDTTGASSEMIVGDGTSIFKVVKQKERVGGAISTVLDADFNSFYSSGIKLNVNTPNTQYPVIVRCGN